METQAEIFISIFSPCWNPNALSSGGNRHSPQNYADSPDSSIADSEKRFNKWSERRMTGIARSAAATIGRTGGKPVDLSPRMVRRLAPASLGRRAHRSGNVRTRLGRLKTAGAMRPGINRTIHGDPNALKRSRTSVISTFPSSSVS